MQCMHLAFSTIASKKKERIPKANFLTNLNENIMTHGYFITNGLAESFFNLAQETPITCLNLCKTYTYKLLQCFLKNFVLCLFMMQKGVAST